MTHRPARNTFGAYADKLLTAIGHHVTRGMPQAGPVWQAMPGQRLELGSTGFCIQLITNPILMPYLLTDPDGRIYARSGELQSLKAYAEQMARDRAEFDAPPPIQPWRAP
jgi:hypothetical protein